MSDQEIERSSGYTDTYRLVEYPMDDVGGKMVDMDPSLAALGHVEGDPVNELARVLFCAGHCSMWCGDEDEQ